MDLTPILPPDRAILVPLERRAAVLDVIRQARSTLLLSLFRCNDKEIFRELKAAVDRGVDVEVLVTSRAKGAGRSCASSGSVSTTPAPRSPPTTTRL
jgi:phosphatidylserine/phosphatidylglycerophosphate/cardiolipin synthase-like enzyme